MKKLLILTNIIWVLITSSFVLKSCSPQKGNNQIEVLKKGDIVINYLDKKLNSLPLEAAKSMAQNYVNIKEGTVTSKKNTIEDTRSVWYSLEELEHFIWLIKYYTKESNLGLSSNDLGVKIYFGRYPEKNILKSDKAYASIDTAYAGLQTVFLIPTIKKGDIDMPFDPLANYIEITNNGATQLSPLFIESNKGDIQNPTTPTTSYSVLNHGNLCPPCKGRD